MTSHFGRFQGTFFVTSFSPLTRARARERSSKEREFFKVLLNEKTKERKKSACLVQSL